MILIFHRKVTQGERRVECRIDGVWEGSHESIGELKFPNTQTWTKFWGAVQRGAMAIADLEVFMENVPHESVQVIPVEPKEPKSDTQPPTTNTDSAKSVGGAGTIKIGGPVDKTK